LLIQKMATEYVTTSDRAGVVPPSFRRKTTL
jgi:hypothetical protein